MSASLGHPDLHFVFPVYKPTGQTAGAVSDQYLNEWREQMADNPYFSHPAWLRRIGVGNQQAIINVSEAENILTKLSTTSSQGGYRVIIVWQADLMNRECANKLLKILEEPATDTVFLLTSDKPDQILGTVLSRTQRIELPPLPAEDIAKALQERYRLRPEDAMPIARAAAGSYTKAIEEVTSNTDTTQHFDLFVLFMRLCYMRKIKDLHEWSLNMASKGREQQKAFLEYCQHLVRENFIYNFRTPELNHLNRDESNFATNFARFINERNVIGIMDEIALAQRDIAQNVNPRMVFFDLSLKMIV